MEMSLVLTLVLAAQTGAAVPAPDAAAKKLVPLAFAVKADPKGGAAASAWADELRTAIAARKDEFRSPRPGEKPEVVVQVDTVGPTATGSAMKGSLVVGDAPHPFSLTYAGPSKPQTEALARNLRKYADQMKTAPPAPAKPSAK
jgi:hypothetical protein